MQEDDIKAVQDKDEAQPHAKRIIAAVVLATAIIISLFLMFLRGDGSQELSLKPETPRQAYLKILGETHTGLRLVRIEDYIANAAPNGDLSRAKTARDTLATHEQMAWAKLTNALYDLNNSEAQKTQALTAYKTTWGVWRRQRDLPKLMRATLPEIDTSETAQYAPNLQQSQFRKGGGEDKLAGDISTATIARPQTKRLLTMSKPPTVQAVRIKYAKRPRYPRRARRKGIEATITLALDIDERGHVAHTHVVSIRAARYKDKFIRAARRAAMGSRFHPKIIEGTPVASAGYLRKYTFSNNAEQ